MSTLTRELVITPAWDKRAGGYGQHAVDMTWYVKGAEGAIQFRLLTGWYPDIIPKTTWNDWSDWRTLSVKRSVDDHDAPMPADLGFHSPKPLYEGQSPMDGYCTILGGPCYYDGSGLNANKPFSILVHEGGEKLWEFLEDYYRKTFAEKVPA